MPNSSPSERSEADSKEAAIGKAGAFKVDLRAAARRIEGAVLVKSPPSESPIDISAAYETSCKGVPGYVTLDVGHVIALREIGERIAEYSEARGRRRPLNFLLQAPPGSGKSHLIGCIAKQLEAQHAKDVSFNMTGMESTEDLASALEQVRNLKVNDQLPLLFLDEVDCGGEKGRDRNIEILLPLLWDGEIELRHRNLKVGKIVIFLATSSSTVDDAIARYRGSSGSQPANLGKLQDFFSRINGGFLRIPDLESERRRADKVCIAISILARRFANIETVPWTLLSFIGWTRFWYGARSIECLLDCIVANNQTRELTREDLGRLDDAALRDFKDSYLEFHVAPEGHAQLWGDLRKYNTSVKIRTAVEKDTSLERFLKTVHKSAGLT